MKRTRLLLLIVALLCLNYTIASATQIIGTIKDNTTGEAIDHADIILMANDTKDVITHTFASTDEQFKFDNINAGKYDLMVRLIG